jgi:hypothetical protein
MSGRSEALNHQLDALRLGTGTGDISSQQSLIAPGIALHCDPVAGMAGHWSSPTGRLVELDATPRQAGNWLALHVTLDPGALTGATWIGFTCRSAAPEQIMVRPCLRSGGADGFTDCFFPRHLLSLPEVLNHADAIHLPSTPEVPPQAPWRELLFFLPCADTAWHLHDLRLFAA